MKRRERLFLIGIAVIMAAAAVVFRLHPPEIGVSSPPADPRVLAERLSRHPTDWEAASALTEVALDTRVPDRVALWRAAFEHARRLAPERTDPINAYVRAAFFHWSELSPRDQSDALNAFVPLLRRPGTFARMARPVFELTGDLSILRRAHPPTEEALRTMITLALTNGYFADYRSLRDELTRKRMEDFAARRGTKTPAELIADFPGPPYHTESEPLIKALLDELHQRPLDESANRPGIVDALVDYALRHDLEPLDGLESVTRRAGESSVPTRIALARKLGMTNIALQLEAESATTRPAPPSVAEWQGLCDRDICYRAWRTIDAAHGVALKLATVQTDNVPAWIEIYVDDALRAEGEVRATRDFVVPVGSPGTHRLEIVLANPTTRNAVARRVHVAGVTTL